MTDRETIIDLLQDVQAKGFWSYGTDMYTGEKGGHDMPPDLIADYLIENGAAVPVRCNNCKHWLHMEDGMGDCTNRRFHLDGHADPTMRHDEFCSLGERR